MAMTDRFKVKISLDIQTEDGTPFFTSTVDYASLPYDGVVMIERKMVNMLDDLVAVGEQKIAAVATLADALV